MSIRKLLIVSTLISVGLVYLFTGPLREWLQHGGAANLFFGFFVLLTVLLVAFNLDSGKTVSRNVTIFSHFTRGDGWHRDLQSDIFVKLPPHLLQEIQPRGSTMVDARQTIFTRLGSPSQETIASIEYRLMLPNAEPTRANKGSLRLLTVLLRRLSGTLDGWVKMASAKNQDDFATGTELESYEFNQQVYIRSKPEKLATYFSSPDFMSWYLEQTVKSVLYAESNILCLVKRGAISYDDLDRLVKQSRLIQQFIDRSGALIDRAAVNVTN